jgi:hypothetical protein
MQHNRYEVHRPVHHVEIDQYLIEKEIKFLRVKQIFFVPRNSSSFDTFNKFKSLSRINNNAINTAVQAITTAAAHNELSNP